MVDKPISQLPTYWKDYIESSKKSSLKNNNNISELSGTKRLRKPIKYIINFMLILGALGGAFFIGSKVTSQKNKEDQKGEGKIQGITDVEIENNIEEKTEENIDEQKEGEELVTKTETENEETTPKQTIVYVPQTTTTTTTEAPQEIKEEDEWPYSCALLVMQEYGDRYCKALYQYEFWVNSISDWYKKYPEKCRDVCNEYHPSDPIEECINICLEQNYNWLLEYWDTKKDEEYINIATWLRKLGECGDSGDFVKPYYDNPNCHVFTDW